MVRSGFWIRELMAVRSGGVRLSGGGGGGGRSMTFWMVRMVGRMGRYWFLEGRRKSRMDHLGCVLGLGEFLNIQLQAKLCWRRLQVECSMDILSSWGSETEGTKVRPLSRSDSSAGLRVVDDKFQTRLTGPGHAVVCLLRCERLGVGGVDSSLEESKRACTSNRACMLVWFASSGKLRCTDLTGGGVGERRDESPA